MPDSRRDFLPASPTSGPIPAIRSPLPWLTATRRGVAPAGQAITASGEGLGVEEADLAGAV